MSENLRGGFLFWLTLYMLHYVLTVHVSKHSVWNWVEGDQVVQRPELLLMTHCHVPVGDNTNNDIYNFIYKTKHVGYVWAAVESTFECPSARFLSLQTACPVTRDNPTKYWVVTPTLSLESIYTLWFQKLSPFLLRQWLSLLSAIVYSVVGVLDELTV